LFQYVDEMVIKSLVDSYELQLNLIVGIETRLDTGTIPFFDNLKNLK